jgi:hypothetical protein
VDLKGCALVTPGQYGGQSIDPMVFTDTDGQAYLYFGQGQLNAVRLNDDMGSFSGTPVNTKPAGSSYNEGTFVFKRHGLYYFMWSKNDTRSGDSCIGVGRGAAGATGLRGGGELSVGAAGAAWEHRIRRRLRCGRHRQSDCACAGRGALLRSRRRMLPPWQPPEISIGCSLEVASHWTTA